MRVLIVESNQTILHNYTLYATEHECEVIGVSDWVFILESGNAVASCDAYVVEYNSQKEINAILGALIPIAGKKPILVHYDLKNRPDVGKIKIELRRSLKKHKTKLSFRRKQWDGANMIRFLERHYP